MTKEWQRASGIPRWAWRLYRKHWPVIVGLSLIPSVQRLVVVNWEDSIPDAAALASEGVVMLVRLALLVTVWRLAAPHGRVTWARAKENWRGLAIQAGLLLLATVIFKFGLEAPGRLLPENAEQTYLAILLFLKNPTIIAFTFVWTVGIVKHLLEESTSDVRTTV